MQAFVPKNRRPKFDLDLKIIDLHNVPLVSGTSFIKWYLPHSAAAEHRGRTSKCHIRDHKVIYDYEKTVPVRMTVDRSNQLQDLEIQFEIIQEYSYGARGERIVLGKLKLNLAEYVEASAAESENGVVRRYLMQESKINSTLRIGICLMLTDGDQNFIAPPLKSAPVFGGIAGIMAGEQGEVEDSGQMSSLNSKSKEAGEVQDMYRRNLAASWSAQPGELRADECIEDIFAGGDGWGSSRHHNDPDNQHGHRSRRSMDHPEPKSRHGHRRHGSKDSISNGDTTPRNSHGFSSHLRNASGRASLDQHSNSVKADGTSAPNIFNNDVDEFDIREDLRSWKLPGAAT